MAAAVLVGLTFTRNAYLGLAAGAVVLVLTARPRLSLALPPLAVLLFLVLPAGVRERAASTFDRTDAAARDRLSMWSSGAAMISERPFFGVGPGRIKELYPVYRRPEFVEASVGHLHNNLVNVAAETGIPVGPRLPGDRRRGLRRRLAALAGPDAARRSAPWPAGRSRRTRRSSWPGCSSTTSATWRSSG